MTIKELMIPLILVLLAACGGNGHSNSNSDSDSDYPGNITAEELSVVTTDPRIAYPIKANISLKADQVKTDVPVTLYAIDATDDPSVEAREIPLGTVVLAQVNDGTYDYDLEVTVPASVEFAGTYYLIAIVDEAGVIDESSKDDNWTETEMTFSDSAEVNILLSEVALDRTALIINTDDYATPTADNTYNADAGATITVGADGLMLGESVHIEAFASLRLNRSDNGTSLEMPLYLWNTAETRYTHAYGVDPITNVTVETDWLPVGQFRPLLAEITGSEATLDDIRRNSEHISFYFPGKLGSELEKALRYPCTTGVCLSAPQIPPPDLTEEAISQLRSFLDGLPFSGERGDESASMEALYFDICVKIRPTDPMVSDSSTADSEVCKPIDIYLPPLPGQPPVYAGITGVYSKPVLPFESSNGLITENNNKYFGFNVDFSASSTANEKGFIGSVTADVPVRLFGKNLDFVAITVAAQLVPDYFNKPDSEESGISVEVRHRGIVLDSTPSFKPTTSSALFSSLIPTQIAYSKEEENEKSFFIGPVPMVINGTVGAYFGLEYEVGYASDKAPVLGPDHQVESLGASIAPFAKLEASLELGVELKAFTAGVEGVLGLLDERLSYFIGTDIEVIDNGHTSNNVEFIITSGQKLSNIFTGPQGNLNFFVKYPVLKWITCKAGFVKYRCIRIRDKKITKNFYSSPALFKRTDVLIEDPWDRLNVVIINGQPPAYFEE